MEKTLLRDLLATLSLYKVHYASAFFFLCTSNFLLIAIPLLIRAKIEGTLPLAFTPAVLLFLSAATLASVCKYLMRVGFITISRDAEMRMRAKLYEKLQNQSTAFFDRYGTGELLSRLTNDVSSYRDVLGPGVMYPLFFLTFVGPGYAALFSISPRLTTIAAIPLLAIPLVNWKIRGRIYELATKVQSGLAGLSNLIQEQFTSIRVIKCYTAEEKMKRRFTTFSQTLENNRERLSFVQGSLSPFFTVLARSITLALVLSTGIVFRYGLEELDTADFLAFMWIQSYIFLPILMLGWLLPVYQKGRAAYDRLKELYESPDPVTQGKDPSLQLKAPLPITFHNLTFAYPKTGRQALHNLVLTVEPGEFLGITGPIGGGKSTLFKLLLREYEVPYGAIQIGGRAIQDYPLETLFHNFSAVEQAPFLFSRTLEENIAFGDLSATKETIHQAAKLAELHRTALFFPNGYKTLLGERGITLSGGQKQRLAMARAFLVDRPILLLDDIFSSVDTDTEQKIFSQMEKVCQGKTVLLISHRTALLERLPRIVYLDHGTVVEEGSPSELKRQGGYYKALVELQELEERIR